MSWATRFRIREYLKGSIWVVPLVGGIVGALLGALDTQIDKSIHLPSDLTYSSSTATTLLSAVVGTMGALTGFVVTVTVLVVQTALGTFSARSMRLWYRDPMLKAVLAVSVGTLAFSFSLLRRVEGNFVPNLGITVAGLLVLASLVLFMVFLDRYLHRLRPVAVAAIADRYVHQEFQRQVTAVADSPDVFSGRYDPDGDEATLVVRSARTGVIQAIHLEGLARWARGHDCLVVLLHRIGDSVPAGAPLIETYGGPSRSDREEGELRGMVALGLERTIEQDPAFAIRIMVDIADKALSAAINDPTTAVQVLNRLEGVLRVVEKSDLTDVRLSADGGPRRGLVVRARSWEEYLALVVTEIREYGATSIQVMRRMRALLEDLNRDVRSEHRQAVTEELARLDSTVKDTFGDSIDLERARIADREGIGGLLDLDRAQP